MKAILLAGGAGDRLWPLSRKNYPKQFMSINGTSIFQETVTKNIPFCDEFLIVTNEAYHEIVEGQMQQFQGINYRIFLEEEGKGTAVAIYLLALMLKEEEDILVLPSDLLIEGENYSDSIYEAKELAASGEIALFGVTPRDSSTSYGYIRHHNSKVTRFIARPTKEMAQSLFVEDNVYWNGGMILVKNSVLQQEMKRYAESLTKTLKPISEQGITVDLQTVRFGKELFNGVDVTGIEECLLEQSDHVSVVRLRCDWKDISDFKAYSEYMGESKGPSIIENSINTAVINMDESRLVVTNDVSDLLVVNVNDATYITTKEHADDIKSIVRKNADSYDNFFNYGPVGYRPWGTREIIHSAKGCRVRKIMLYPGATLSKHSHEKRNENYSVVSGVLSIEIGEGETLRNVELKQGDGINILPGMMHRLYNNTDHPVVAIEVDTGVEIEERDMVHNDTEKKSDLPSLYRLRPAFKDYLWGGQRLKTMYKKDSPYEITAESWELSAHPAGPSVIHGGDFDGTEFLDFVTAHGAEVCGWKSKTFDRFPILIKFIDAKNSLSVQIHPDDDYAFVKEGEFGKNEVWYVMDAEPGAFLYCGLKEPTSKEEIRRRIADNTVTEILNKVEVLEGDVVFIPAGTIHAIGAGLFICEIQQSSNCTYRLYDFGRLDKDGNPRELHIDKAMDVVDTEAYEQNAYGLGEERREGDALVQTLCRCKYFESTKYKISGEALIKMDDASFRSIVVLSGNATISTGDESMDAAPGESFFVSAGRKVVHISGECEIIVTNI